MSMRRAVAPCAMTMCRRVAVGAGSAVISSFVATPCAATLSSTPSFAPIASQQQVRFQSSGPVADANGVVEISGANLSAQLKGNTPTIFYFYVKNHAEVSKYTADLKEQIMIANRDNKEDAHKYEATGTDRDLSVKLAMVDCLKEGSIAMQFGINPEQFPLVLFLWRQQVVDRLPGIVPAAQVKDMVTSFMTYCQNDHADMKAGKGPGGIERPTRMDNDDENCMTLIQAAQKKLKDNDFVKGVELYEKAVVLGREKVEALKIELGLDKKKMTPELFAKLKKDPHYFALAQAMCGLAMCHCSKQRVDEAQKLTDQVRSEFPAAVKELRDVAEAVARVELLVVTKFDLEKDNYVTLMKREDLLNDPVTFYMTNLKLAAAHVFEKRHKAGIDECLRLIRAEPKILGDLKKGGVVAADASLSTRDSTPARKAIFLIFEALGNTHEHVIDGRKKLAAYLSV